MHLLMMCNSDMTRSLDLSAIYCLSHLAVPLHLDLISLFDQTNLSSVPTFRAGVIVLITVVFFWLPCCILLISMDPSVSAYSVR